MVWIIWDLRRRYPFEILLSIVERRCKSSVFIETINQRIDKGCTLALYLSAMIAAMGSGIILPK
jgi:hypothetical protein